MNEKLAEEFLKGLFSKRKQLRLRSGSLSWLDLTATERDKLYEEAEKRGLLTRYEFSGIQSLGISRNNAADRLLQATRQHAFEKLKAEFGAKARFWADPPQLSSLGVDFYWKLAKLAIHITGPLTDAVWRAGPTRARAAKPQDSG